MKRLGTSLLFLGALASSFATTACTARYVVVAPDELEARNDRAWQVRAEPREDGSKVAETPGVRLDARRGP